MATILIVDDQDRYAELFARSMPEHRYRGPARNAADALDAIRRSRGRVDLVLLDVHFDIEPTQLLGYEPSLKPAAIERLKRRQGLLILSHLRSRHPELPVIVLTSEEGLDLEHEEALVNEEFTYFLEDDYLDVQALRTQIEAVAAVGRAQDADGPIFWGRSRAMKRVRQKLAIFARGRLPLTLLGPTGTGKSLIARHFVHERSGRAGPFVAVDLSTVPADLMAAHLFGAARGAYTGSASDRPGAFEAARGGTLFLDEIGNLTLDAQKMLLSVLQEGTFRRLGDVRERSVDVKLIVATNEDLASRVAERSFRADLHMRLNPAAAVSLPSLSERGTDLGRLLDFCTHSAMARPELLSLAAELEGSFEMVDVVAGSGVPAARKGALIVHYPDRSMRMIRAHDWPGNLREFAMVIENALLVSLAETVAVPAGNRPDVLTIRPSIVRDLLQASMPAESELGTGRFRVSIEPAETLNKVAVACERQYFTQLFLDTQGDFSAMAALLLGDSESGRKVQLRFNQLGLKVRELRTQLP